MDLGLSETQEMLSSTARDFFERECPAALVRQMEDDDLGYPPELWQRMGELGWMGLAFPDAYGGADGSLTELAVLLEEMGRALAPSPFFHGVVLVGLTILDAGSPDQQRELLPGIATGALIATMALTEESARYSAEGIRMPASTESDTYTLRGSKMFVEYAHVADHLLVPVRTDSSGTAEHGITLLLVPKDSPGISLVPLTSIARDKQFEVAVRRRGGPEFSRGWTAGPGLEHRETGAG